MLIYILKHIEGTTFLPFLLYVLIYVCFYSNSSITSVIVGIDGTAPGLVTAIDAALEAIRNASSGVFILKDQDISPDILLFRDHVLKWMNGIKSGAIVR